MKKAFIYTNIANIIVLLASTTPESPYHFGILMGTIALYIGTELDKRGII